MLTQKQLLASLKYKPGDADTPIESLPSISDLDDFLRELERKGPVVHRGPMEPVVEDRSKFPLIRLASGRYSVKPNITQQNFLYRGESCYYPESKSLFGRDWSHAKGMLANIQQNELYWALKKSHPLYQLLAKGIELSDSEVIRIENPGAIASVYGMTTTQHHLTSDLDVALFYATSDFNAGQDTYAQHQITEEDVSKVGCIYLFNIAMPMSQIPMLTTAGYLPFPRMKDQRTFLFNLGRDIDFSKIPLLRKLYFKHSQQDDLQYSQKFNSGALLNVSDEIAVLARRIMGSAKISERAFRTNLNSNPTDDENQNRRELENLQKTIVPQEFLFSAEDLAPYYQRIENGFWSDFCDSLDFSTFRHPEDVKAAFIDLPNNTNYQQYFTR